MTDVLIALCGLTPQVVTETLWALGRQRPAIVPGQMRIITTESGRHECERVLLGKNGKLGSYWREYCPGHKLCTTSVVTLKDSTGRPIEDLRTPKDNLSVADQLAAVIRELTAVPSVRLHCSVAGGRKTMGVLLAAVLQVYGRPEDRLYHVLVPAPFESHPEFFYISRRPRLLDLPNGKRLDAKRARIELAEIPYIRLRAFLPEHLLTEPLPFTELVDRAQKHLRALERVEVVTLDTSARRLFIGETAVKLTRAQALLYTTFARIKMEQCAEPTREHCEDCISCYPTVSKDKWDSVCEPLEALAGERFLSAGIGYFRSLLSKTNNAIMKELGAERLAGRYRIRSDGVHGETRYGLAVDKTLIRIE